jgi:excisionase family DNA binding protein
VASKTPQDEVFMTTEEVPAYLQVNLRTVYRLIKARKIPAVRVGRQWRFRKRDIDAWLEGQSTVAQAPAAVEPAGTERQAGAARILVVDDEPGIRELLSRMLASYVVDTASDAESALRLLRAADARYDLMIADLKMPGADGLSLIRQAREINAALPVIIITGFSTKASAIEAVNLGVAGYLTKPFQVSQVLAAASRAMGA